MHPDENPNPDTVIQHADALLIQQDAGHAALTSAMEAIRAALPREAAAAPLAILDALRHEMMRELHVRAIEAMAAAGLDPLRWRVISTRHDTVTVRQMDAPPFLPLPTVSPG